jgi:apolipoprotein N-acyltransferase
MLIQLLIALAAGATMPLAFAPFHFWPVAILSPALLIFQLDFMSTRRQTFWLGCVWGLGYFGFGVSWIYNSLHTFGNAPPLVAGGLTALMVVTLSLFVGAALYLVRRSQERHPAHPLIWLLPLIWFSMEWMKGWVLTGFPWLSIGYAHLNSPLGGFAPVIGVYGVGSLSMLISVMLVRWKRAKDYLTLGIIALIGLAGFALQQVEWTKPVGPALDISMVQGNIAQDMKWRRDMREKIIDTYWKASRQYLDSDLIVWPEVAIPGRSEDMQALLKSMEKTLREHQTRLLTGIVVSDWMKREYYNSMLMLGVQQGVYHKRHLVPFGEYYPFRSLISWMRQYIKIPMSDMTPGPDRQPMMSVKDIKIGVSICFEDVFSRDINLDLPQANILLNTSNDAWFGDSLAPHQHLQIAQMRALETGRPMVRSTNTGSSAFIDHKGKITEALALFKLETARAKIQGRSGATPFISFAKIQPWLAVIILFIVVFLGFFAQKKSTTEGLASTEQK